VSHRPTWTLTDLRARVRAFAHERDWEQFHSPKNLSMSIAIEAAELMECFQWVPEGAGNSRQEAVDELSDVLIYCLVMADALEIDDLGAVVVDKLKRSSIKYPADRFRGRFK
jgi:NTP pyrophosphatase (non-canonical NTP hydrolase)